MEIAKLLVAVPGIDINAKYAWQRKGTTMEVKMEGPKTMAVEACEGNPRMQEYLISVHEEFDARGASTSRIDAEDSLLEQLTAELVGKLNDAQDIAAEIAKLTKGK